MIRIVGVDASIASTGVARADVDVDPDPDAEHRGVVTGSWTGRYSAPALTVPTVAARAHRLDLIGVNVDELIGEPDLLVIEGPAPGLASNRGGHDLAGAWWAIVSAYVARRGVDVRILVVAPSKLAVYLAGHGRAEKPEHVKAARRLYGDRFDIPVTAAAGEAGDIADAIGLVAIGARVVDLPIDRPHPKRLGALVGVTEGPPPKTSRAPRKRTTTKAPAPLTLHLPS